MFCLKATVVKLTYERQWTSSRSTVLYFLSYTLCQRNGVQIMLDLFLNVDPQNNIPIKVHSYKIRSFKCFKCWNPLSEQIIELIKLFH
jgi:hypothetical protein